jgi:hypothetical protein
MSEVKAPAPSSTLELAQLAATLVIPTMLGHNPKDAVILALQIYQEADAVIHPPIPVQQTHE